MTLRAVAKPQPTQPVGNLRHASARGRDVDGNVTVFDLATQQPKLKCEGVPPPACSCTALCFRRKRKSHRVGPTFGQASGLYRALQSKCWGNLHDLGQPCEFHVFCVVGHCMSVRALAFSPGMLRPALLALYFAQQVY